MKKREAEIPSRSDQRVLVVEGKRVRSRLLSPREAAPLMGLSDAYRFLERYNDAHHVCGDGVCVPVVRRLAARVLEPLLKANRTSELIAAGQAGRPTRALLRP